MLAVPSIIKSHLAWVWQTSTINRGDELLSLPLGCLQPYQLVLADYTTPDGRRSGLGKPHFGVLAIYHETKVLQPDVSVVTIILSAFADHHLAIRKPSQTTTTRFLIETRYGA